MMVYKQRISHKDFFTSVGLVLLSTLFFTLAAELAKYLTTLGPLQLIVLIRFLAPFILLLLWFLLLRKSCKVKSWQLAVLRSVVVVGAQYCLFYVIAHSNVLLATLLYATSGLFSPLLTALFLKERLRLKTIISIIISFTGVVVFLHTWQNILAPISLIGLLSGFLTAIGQMTQHRSSKVEEADLLNFWLFGLSSFFSLLILLLTTEKWQSPFFSHLSLLTGFIILAFSLFSIGNQTCKTYAFKRVNKAASLVPFLYTTIIFSAVIDWLWYGIIPELHNIIGIVVIFVGVTLMSIRRVKI